MSSEALVWFPYNNITLIWSLLFLKLTEIDTYQFTSVILNNIRMTKLAQHINLLQNQISLVNTGVTNIKSVETYTEDKVWSKTNLI